MPAFIRRVGAILACPEHQHNLRVVPLRGGDGNFAYYRCTFQTSKREPTIDYANHRGIPNLFPFDYIGEDSRFEPKEKLSAFRCNSKEGVLSLNEGQVYSLLSCAHRGDVRGLNVELEQVIRTLPHDSEGNLLPQGAILVAKGLNEFFMEHHRLLRNGGALRLLGGISIARYEAELEFSKDYRGNFVLPDRAIEHLRDANARTVAEVAMGNGATLRRIAEGTSADLLIGFDNCLGMVRAARRLTTRENFFYALADAHFLPLRSNSMDGLVMLNALDRLQNAPQALDHYARVVRDGGVIIIGNCTPLQYDVSIGQQTISLVDQARRFESVEQAVSAIKGAEIVDSIKALEWHPETVSQGRENLEVDVVVARMKKAA